MTRQPPDVTAFELPAAIERLRPRGWQVARKIQTGPPDRSGRGPMRVVRQTALSNTRIELVVTHPEFDHSH